MVTALIVEDSLTDRDLLTRYLQQSSIRVMSAQSSEEALKMLQTTPPDLVFLDVVLPGQSGFEFCSELKTTDSTKNIPVVICSNKDTKADKLWGSMLGADAYLTKPIQQQALNQILEQLMAIRPKP
jgi:two-component system, chemotaxis family, response regulator PixH